MIPTLFFLLALAFAASGWASPPTALAIGLVFGLLFTHPFPESVGKYSRWLLQASVVGLGFAMNLHDVVRAGRSGFLYTLLGIGFSMTAGMGLGALLRVQRKPAFLISTGTAICGGSAIAAVGPVAGASGEQMAVSLGTIFVLNSVALLIFPLIGAAFHLSQSQFGLWAALAIHDTSSVVGAAAKYGSGALAVGTTVKLARALWIVPMTLGTALARHTKAKIQWPWFIALFCFAAVLNTYVNAGAPVYPGIAKAARVGMTVTLFLIGSGISIATLKRVGPRPLLQGVLLWLLVSVTSLWLIRVGWISL
ncbi:MAG: putative sulfate exporter family transporter [Acidobacteriales bacterium]|nr:putative sulfate exporter family transporter [Candidatus Koribacter versatilis]MBI3646093.1 putative sulfate exporter family transporter [Terriglobales bacterium]